MRLIKVNYRIGALWFSQTASLLRDRVIMVINTVCDSDGEEGRRLERKGCERVLRGALLPAGVVGLPGDVSRRTTAKPPAPPALGGTDLSSLSVRGERDV